MKRLTVGIRRNGKSPGNIRQQLLTIPSLSAIRFELPEHQPGEHVPETVFAEYYPSDEQVAEILERLLEAGLELCSLSCRPIELPDTEGSESRQPTAPDVQEAGQYIPSFETTVRSMNDIPPQLLELFLKTTSAGSRKINLPTLNGFRRFDLASIIRCESTDNYTNVYFTDHKKILVSRSLQEFESRLSACGFFRVHHKHLINTEHIVEYHKGKGGQVIMSDNSSIDVSVRKKSDFIRYINDFS